jgi:hypothetical protein
MYDAMCPTLVFVTFVFAGYRRAGKGDSHVGHVHVGHVQTLCTCYIALNSVLALIASDSASCSKPATNCQELSLAVGPLPAELMQMSLRT